MKPLTIPCRPRLTVGVAFFFVVSLPFLILGPVAAAQDAPAAAYDDAVEVRVVNLQAVVVDRRGDRVYHLKPQDFRLRVDGQEVPVDYFNEIFGGVAVRHLAAEAGVAQAAGQAVPTRYVIFLDETFTAAHERQRVLASASAQLSRLEPEDRLAVVAYDGRSLAMLGDWVGAGDAFEPVLAAAKARWSSGQQVRAARRAVQPCRAARRLENAQITEMQEAAGAALRRFAHFSGRKVLLLVSGGWRSQLRPCGRLPGAADGRRDAAFFRPLADLANQLGFTVYPLITRRENLIEARWLAAATGGEALAVEGGEPLARVVDDTRAYYWLGFHAPWRGDGQQHRVELEAAHPGARVRARSSYVELSGKTLAAVGRESQLLFAEAPASPRLAVELAASDPIGRGLVAAPLTVRFPADGLTALQAARGYVLQLELRVAALDDRGWRSETPAVPFTVRTAQPPQPGDEVRYETLLTLRNRPQTLVVSIDDPVGIAAYSTTVRYEP